MKLLVQIGDTELIIEITTEILENNKPFYEKLDADMDKGMQVEREFVDDLNAVQRAQVIANRLMTQIENSQHEVATLMAGYILFKLPGVTKVDINIEGEISLTEFSKDPLPEMPAEMSAQMPESPANTDPAQASVAVLPGALSPAEASAKARKEVSKVEAIEGGFHFKTLDPEFGDWIGSEIYTDKAAAEEVRMEMFQFRFQQLMGKA